MLGVSVSSIHVTPALATRDAAYLPGVDIKSSRCLGLSPTGSKESANAAYDVFGECGCVVLLTALRVGAKFCVHVQGVVLGCAEKQVGRIHARTVVAAMADIESTWNGANMRFEAGSVCSDRAIVNGDDPVAGVRDAATPIPAPSAMIDACP